MAAHLIHRGLPLVAQLVTNPPTMRETWAQSLGWEDPLEKGTATHCSILAWRIPWPEFPQLHVFWERDETMPGQFFTLKFEGARGVRKVIK